SGQGRPLALQLDRGVGGAEGGLVGHSDPAHLRGGVPGWYVLVARWEDDEAPRDAACVELTAPRREIWGDVTMALGDLHVAPVFNPVDLYVRTRAGYLHYLRPHLGVGAVFGYAYTANSWDTRPAWHDFADANDEPLKWARHALLVGGAVESRTRFARVPFDLRLRATPTLNLGLLDLSGIPPTLSSFRGGAAGRTGNIDVDIDIHVDAIIGYVVGKVAVQHVLLLGLHAIDDPLARISNNARDNSGFFLGFGIGIGGAR
ncbi:MAG: hypothetical protein KC486_35280, partial [Myxococcales bacterium]|nr:hypothetical protein [Myxococcales bacterium]